MKASIKMYRSDGKTEYGFPVKLIISHLGKRKRKLICYSEENDWNHVREEPKDTHDDYEDILGRILNIRALAGKMEFREFEDLDKAMDYLLGSKPKRSKVYDFYQWGDRCVQLLKTQKKTGTAQSYQNSLDAIKRFSPQLKFSELTPYFLNDFKDFCKGRGNENKTIKHYGGALKAIYNRAVHAGVTEDTRPFENFSRNIPTRDRRKKQRYMELEDIQKLENADLPDGQRRAVDLILLQFYLGGADFVEIYNLKKEQLTRNRVFFFRQKLSDIAFEVDVLVPKKAEMIFQKYWAHDGEYIFPWRKDEAGYKTFIQNTRRALKIVQQKLRINLKPKDENLTTKVMRHTFATLAKYSRIEEDMIRELMGHERKDQDTIYKAKYLEAERDAAQLKIIGEKMPLLEKKRTVKRALTVRRVKRN